MIKYKLVGGPLHGKKFDSDVLPPLLLVSNGNGEKAEYYRFNEMRGNRYYVYTWINECREVRI